jgi:hypothetical protein
MNYGVTTLAVWAGVILLAADAQAASPLDDLIEPKPGAGACFIRAYDAAHLRQHPAQKTTFIGAWMRYEKAPEVETPMLGFSFAIKRRGDGDALFSQGGCYWDRRANRDTSNRRLISAFPRDEAAVCSQSARPDVFETVSAEEGGALIINRGKDKNTLMIYLDDSLLMVKRAERDNSLNIAFGPEDRVFMMRRADAKECAFIEEAVTAPEPAARDRRR